MTVRFKDLCLNTTHPQPTADFWSATLDLRAEPDAETYVLRGDAAEETVWLNRVPEAKQGKARVHLDVNLLSLAEVVDRGAVVLDDSHGWVVCSSPDGVEFCVFVRTPEQLAGQRPLYEIGIDCADPERLCRWWAQAYGVSPEHDPAHDWWWLGDGAVGLVFGVVFARVPEAKMTPNWIHWDVVGDPAELVEAGATVLRARDDEISWDVLADPEGNEFCVFTE